MAKKKNNNKNREPQEIKVPHKPKKERFHVAQEFKDLHGVEAAHELVRKLLPSAADRALGVPEVSGHTGWQPQVRNSRF